MAKVKIISIDVENLEFILPLIGDYQSFYKSQPNIEKNRKHFSIYVQNSELGILFGAFDEEKVAVGFATLYFVPASVEVGKTCLMNDLYCAPDRRGEGIARALIEKCREHAGQKGFSSLEWHTQIENETAQKLYDRVGAQRSQWYIYNWKT